jgi:peptidyl-prolyl cis-trans isomerase B (cyclophilin B)
MKRKKLSRLMLAALLIGVQLTACATEGDMTKMPLFLEREDAPFERPDGAKNPVVTIEMESGGKIVLELYYDKAPNTVRNFMSLAKRGFYDGLIFHRVMQGFMIQGGDPEGSGSGHPGYRIPGEFPNAGFTQNDLSHTAGTISMARQGRQDPEADKAFHNTAGSQFFICDVDSTFLDGNYAPFGRVTEGMDEVLRIAAAATDMYDKPLSDEKMTRVTADTFRVEYPPPVGTKE